MEIWSLRGKKILIVDDLPDMRTMLRTLVASLGAEDIHTAKDGDQAMSAMRIHKFDVVLCDYVLGEGRDGQQVLEEVRHQGVLPYTAIFVMVTAETSTPMVMGAVEYSPDDYLSKPIPKATLQTRLRSLLGKKEKLHPILIAMQQQNYTVALAQCDQLMEREPASRFELLRLKGELLVTTGSYEKARELYTGILELRELPWAMLGLGKALYRLQQYEAAVEVLRRLIDSHPMVVAAYDLLSLVLEAQGELQAAQEVTGQALQRSWKSVLRQRRYGELAFHNADYDVAEKAYKQALRVGKGSCMRGPAEFAGLAQTFVKKGAPVDAVKMVETMSREFREDAGTMVQVALVGAQVQQGLGNAALSQESIKRAVQLFHEHPEVVGSDLAMDVAQLCFRHGDADAARDLLRHALRNQHEDVATQRRVLELFSEAGFAAEGQSFIDATVEEVAEINNQGVRLAQEGRLEESISFFEKAARGMPGNVVINLNAAQSLVMFMRKQGVARSDMQKAEAYLGRVRELDATNPKYQKLKELLNQMAVSQ